jgi:hypothetical protein
MERADVEARLRVAEERRRQAEERLAAQARRLEEIDEERASLLGEAALAERSIADFDAYEEQLRRELHAIAAAEAEDAFRRAIAARDQAVEKAADAVRALVAAVGDLAAARDGALAAHREWLAHDASAPVDVPLEPALFEAAWDAAAETIRAAGDARRQEELVEAAARSFDAGPLNDLPEHLRERARERKRALTRRATEQRTRRMP